MANNPVVDPVVDSAQNGQSPSVDDLIVEEPVVEEELVKEEPPKEAQPSALPERFQGKTPEEIAASYRELESRFGQQGNELGELRRLTDKILTRDLQQTQPVEDNLSDDDFITRPSEAVKKLVEESLAPIKEQLQATNNAQTLASLEAKHPDMRAVVQDEGFQAWVLDSPARQANWQLASSGDFAQADDLFRQYKEYVRPQQVEATSQQPVVDEKLKAKQQAQLETAVEVQSGGAAASDETKPKPKFDRRRLINLQIEDPARYRAMQREILEAYDDGRVV